MKSLFEIKVKSMKIDVSIIREIIGKTVIASVTIAETVLRFTWSSSTVSVKRMASFIGDKTISLGEKRQIGAVGCGDPAGQRLTRGFK